MNAHTNSFGSHQTSLRITYMGETRTYIGLGHTPGEARSNALDAIEDRHPDLAGFCAVMKSSVLPVERTTAVGALS